MAFAGLQHVSASSKGSVFLVLVSTFGIFFSMVCLWCMFGVLLQADILHTCSFGMLLLRSDSHRIADCSLFVEIRVDEFTSMMTCFML